MVRPLAPQPPPRGTQQHVLGPIGAQVSLSWDEQMLFGLICRWHCARLARM